MEINEKKLKKILSGERREYQRYLGVLAENFESQIKLVAESTAGIQEQLIALRDMVAINTENIEIMKTDLHIIKNDLKDKTDRDELRALEKRVLSLERKLARA